MITATGTVGGNADGRGTATSSAVDADVSTRVVNEEGGKGGKSTVNDDVIL